MNINRFASILLCPVITLIASNVYAADLPRNSAEQIAFDEDCEGNHRNMNICSNYDFKVLDARLNELYKKLTIRLKNIPDDKKCLINSQRAWLKYIDADCLYQAGPIEGAGSIWGVEINSCMSEHYKTRIQILNGFLSCVENGC